MTAVAPVVVGCGGRWVGWTGDCSFGVEDDIPEASEEDTTPTAGLLKHQVREISGTDANFLPISLETETVVPGCPRPLESATIWLVLQWLL